MKSSLAATFLELGDATSRNLEFSQHDGWVSYGEETITETNLLEIRRRHPERVHIHTFPKPQEARNGADWEWHVVGREWTLKMRVQAKRLQRDDVLKVKHKVKSSGKQQRDLLVSEASADRMKAVYCIYCTEWQRQIWKALPAPRGYRSVHTGCLLADAEDVPLATGKLCQIEEKCIPWHYLVERCDFVQRSRTFITAEDKNRGRLLSIGIDLMEVGTNSGDADKTRRSGWNAPTVDDLNGDTDRDCSGETGVDKTTPEDEEMLVAATVEGHRKARLVDLGISRMVIIDVRDETDFAQRR